MFVTYLFVVLRAMYDTYAVEILSGYEIGKTSPARLVYVLVIYRTYLLDTSTCYYTYVRV